MYAVKHFFFVSYLFAPQVALTLMQLWNCWIFSASEYYACSSYAPCLYYVKLKFDKSWNFPRDSTILIVKCAFSIFFSFYRSFFYCKRLFVRTYFPILQRRHRPNSTISESVFPLNISFPRSSLNWGTLLIQWCWENYSGSISFALGEVGCASRRLIPTFSFIFLFFQLRTTYAELILCNNSGRCPSSNRRMTSTERVNLPKEIKEVLDIRRDVIRHLVSLYILQ